VSIPNNNYSIAIIGDGQITTRSGSRPYPTADILNVTGLATIALAKADGQRALWIAPGSDLARKATHASFWEMPDIGDAAPGWKIFATGPQDSIPNAASVRRNGVSGEARREVMIYADIDTRWMLADVADGPPWAPTHHKYLDYITTYEQTMGVQARFTPASTALALLQKLHTDCSSVAYLDPLSRDAYDRIPWPTHHAVKHANQYVRDGKFVHVFDKRSAYMASAMGEVGRGDPIHWSAYSDPLADDIQKETPGLWCISAHVPNAYGMGLIPDISHGALPSPFNSLGDVPDHEWYYTPQVKLAMMMGYQVQVHEAYIWPKHHRTLRPWVTRLWDARQAVRGTPTEAMIKTSVNDVWGVMKRPVKAEEKLQWYHRPDWSGMVTAQHYLRHTRKIMEMEVVYPGYLATSTDSIAWSSLDPNPMTALPAGWAGKPGQLGEYRHVATYAGDRAQTLISMARECQSGARLYKQMNEWDGDEDGQDD